MSVRMNRHYKTPLLKLTMVLAIGGLLLPWAHAEQKSALATMIEGLSSSKHADNKALVQKLSPHLSAIESENRHIQFKFYSMLALAYGHLDNLEASNRYHHAADRAAPEAVLNSDSYAIHLVDWAANYFESTQLEEGELILQRLYTLANTTGNQHTLMQTLNIHLVYAQAQEQWQHTHSLSKRAIDIAFSADTKFPSQRHKLSAQSISLQRAARLYREFEPLKAIELYELALPITQKNQDLGGTEGCLHALAYFHLRLGNTAKAERYITKMMALAKDNRRPMAFISAFTNRSALKLNSGDTAGAYQDILRAKIHVTATTIPAMLEEYLLQYANVYMAQQQYASAVELLEQHNDLFDRSTSIPRRLDYFDVLSTAYAGNKQHQRANALQQKALELSNRWQEQRKSRQLLLSETL